jgi:hypothetical protein
MLIETYTNIFNKPDLWKYYNDLDCNTNPFENDSAAEGFIKSYFQAGNKESVFDKRFPSEKDRNIHSISTFFLGFLVKPLLHIPEPEPSFSYLWFITCLYHDYGYYIENHKEKYLPKKSCLNKLIEQLGIKYNILNTKYDSQFSKKILTRYFRLCQNEYCFINHGIIGGILLYDKLKKNYIEVKNKAVSQKIPGAKKNDFIYNNLRWASMHGQYYKEAANTILAHNIWYAKLENSELYRAYKLDELIIEYPDQRLCSTDYPLLFLLVLADTIEPIKAFNHLSAKCVLQKLNISVDKASNMINIKVIDECINYQSWFNKIIDLKNWAKVSVSQNNNKLTIRIE